MSNETQTARSEKILWFNVAFLIGTPILAAILLPLHIYNNGIHWSEPVALIVLWILTGLGITAGYHRMFSHRTWWAPAPVRFIALILGAATWQNSAIVWSAGHRYHHKDVDSEDDPYSITRGFLYAHMLWVMMEGARHDDLATVPDLQKDPLCAWQHKNYNWIAATFNIGVPVALGLWTGNIWGMLLWAGLLRIVVVHHMTFLINSLAHTWGGRGWSANHSARDNAVVALLTLGEGYHNFHHTFPADYRNGVRWYQFDPTKWLIWSLSRVGLAYDLRRTTIDRRLRKRWQVLYARYQEQAHTFSDSVREQFEEAERRLEAAVTEVRDVRMEWRQKAEELQTQAIRDYQRACRDAERRLLAEFREIQRLLAMPRLENT